MQQRWLSNFDGAPPTDAVEEAQIDIRMKIGKVIERAQRTTAAAMGTELPPKVTIPGLGTTTLRELSDLRAQIQEDLHYHQQWMDHLVKRECIVQDRFEIARERFDNAQERVEKARQRFREAEGILDLCKQRLDRGTAATQDMIRRVQELDRKFLARRKREIHEKKLKFHRANRIHTIANRRSWIISGEITLKAKLDDDDTRLQD